MKAGNPLLTIVLASTCIGSAAFGKDHLQQTYYFDIAAQDLTTAVSQWKAITGALYSLDAVSAEKIISAPVQGTLSADLALCHIVRGTPFQVVYTDEFDYKGRFIIMRSDLRTTTGVRIC